MEETIDRTTAQSYTSRDLVLRGGERFNIVRSDGSIESYRLERKNILDQLIGSNPYPGRKTLVRQNTSLQLRSLAEKIVRRVANNMPDSTSDILQAEKTAIFDRIQSRFNDNDSEPYPILDGTINFFRQDGKFRMGIITEPPQLRTVYFSKSFIDSNYADAKIQHPGKIKPAYNLMFPWIAYIYVQEINDNSEGNFLIFYLSKPLESLDDQLINVNLPNTWEDGRVCLGNDLNFVSGFCANFHAIIDYYWKSSFNDDITDGFYSLARNSEIFRTVPIWEENSLKNPDKITGFDWANRPSQSVNECIEENYVSGLSSSNLEDKVWHLVNNFIDNLADKLRRNSLPAANRDTLVELTISELQTFFGG